MMQAKAFSEKSALFYRTSRSQIPQLAALLKSFCQNYCTIFYKESTCPQPQDVASTSRSMHPVLFTVCVCIHPTCILCILTCDLINCRPTNAVLFYSFPEYISATFYTKGQNLKISPSYCFVYRAMWTFRLPHIITAPELLLFKGHCVLSCEGKS